MPIDTRIAGDPAAVRGAGGWLRDRFATAVTYTVDEVHGARRDSESAWTGGSADAFRSRTLTASAGADRLAEDAVGVARSLDRYAADLDTALAGMERARRIAADGGLAVVDGVVQDPGPGMTVPMLPAGSTPEQAEAHAAAMGQAQAAQRRIAAYEAAVDEAAQARQVLRRGVEVGRDYWNEVRGKWHLNAADFTNGLIGGLAEQRKKAFLAVARDLQENADFLRNRYLRAPGGSAEARALTRAEFVARNGADDALRRAGGVVSTITRRAPIVGGLITAAGIGYDIHQGKPPGKAILSGAVAGAAAIGVGYYGTTALVALTVSNPVGWAALGAVAAGVGVGMAADWAYDEWVPDDVRAAIDDGLTTVGEGIADGASDAWEAVFG